MEHRENDTLESIIRAAKEMAQRRTQERAQKKAAAESLPATAEQLSDSPHSTVNREPAVDINLSDETDKDKTETTTENTAASGSVLDDTNELTSTDVPAVTDKHSTTDEISDTDETSDTNKLSVSQKTIGELMEEFDACSEQPDKNNSKFIDPDPSEAPIDFSDTAALLSAAQTFSDTLQTAGVHFLEFSVAFISMVKRHYQQDGGGDVRANSLSFLALLALDSWSNDHYTMSDLAEKLQIPKQQLTKLINDLETKGLVERIHDTENRRRVYIRICNAGRILMDEVKQEMLQSTLHGLRAYSKEELQEMDQCICRLTELMEKFNTEPL